MTLVSDGFSMTISLKDHGGNTSTLAWNFRAATTVDFAAALTGASTMATRLALVTNSVISRYSVKETFIEDTFVLPIAGVENEDKASVSFSVDGIHDNGNLQIPAPVSAGADNIFGSVGGAANQVNLDAPTLVSYTDQFRVVGQFEISHGHSLNTLLVGKRISAKNNNG